MDTKAEPGKKTVQSTARKVVAGYVPPFALLEPTKFDRVLLFIQYEQITDLGIIQPTAEILYAIDCSKRMTRRLSVSGTIDGKHVATNTPSEWQDIGSLGNPANLYKILCTFKSYNKL